jgi:hypothetical protein
MIIQVIYFTIKKYSILVQSVEDVKELVNIKESFTS